MAADRPYNEPMPEGAPQICRTCGYAPPSSRDSAERNVPCKQCGYMGFPNEPQPQRPAPLQEPQMVRNRAVHFPAYNAVTQAPVHQGPLPPSTNGPASIFQPILQSTPIEKPRLPVQQDGRGLQMPHVSSIGMPNGQFVPPEQCLNCCFQQKLQEQGHQPPPPTNKPPPIFQPIQQSTPKAKSEKPAQKDGRGLQMSHVSSIGTPTEQFMPPEQCLRCCFQRESEALGYQPPAKRLQGEVLPPPVTARNTAQGAKQLPQPNVMKNAAPAPPPEKCQPGSYSAEMCKRCCSARVPDPTPVPDVPGGNDFLLLDETSGKVERWQFLPSDTFTIRRAQDAEGTNLQSRYAAAPAQAIQLREPVQQQAPNLVAPVQEPAFLKAPGAEVMQPEVPGLPHRPANNSPELTQDQSTDQSDGTGPQLLLEATVPGLSEDKATSPPQFARMPGAPVMNQQQSTGTSAASSKFGPLNFIVLQPASKGASFRTSQPQAANRLHPTFSPIANAVAAALKNQLPQVAHDSQSTSSRSPEELGQRLLAGLQQREMLRRVNLSQSGDTNNIQQSQT